MTITVTDQRNPNKPSKVYNFRAELFDDNGYPVGLGYGTTQTEAVEDACEDYRDRIESDIRVALKQFEAQAVAL